MDGLHRVQNHLAQPSLSLGESKVRFRRRNFDRNERGAHCQPTSRLILKCQLGNRLLHNCWNWKKPCLPAAQNALFLIRQLLPQRLHLRTELVDDFLEVLDAGELFPNRLGKLACDPICGDANWLVQVLQSVLHDWAAPALAKKEADRGSIEGRPYGSVDRREIEAQFAGILRLKLSSFQLNHEITVQTNVVKEQVYVKRVIVGYQRYLAANKGEAAAGLKQQIAQVDEQASLQLSFGKRVSRRWIAS